MLGETTLLWLIGSIFHLQEIYQQSHDAHCDVKVMRVAATNYSDKQSLHKCRQENSVLLNIGSALSEKWSDDNREQSERKMDTKRDIRHN